MSIRIGRMRKKQVVKPLKRCACAAAILFTGILVITAPGKAQAQVSSNEINYFSRCRAISDNQARLSCYDRLYDQAVRAVTPGSEAERLEAENRRMREELARIRGQAAPAPVVSSAPPRQYQRREPPQARARVGDFGKKQSRVEQDDNGKDVLFDRISELQKIANGWAITLASGQVWYQMYNKRYNLRVGQEVKISPTIWGDNYHLSVKELGSFIQVKRVK